MAREEVDLTGLSDDELDDDEALRQAIALSLQDQETSEPDLRSDKGEPPAPKAQEPRGGAAFGSLVLDRKAMEEERLRRLASKRPRSSDDEAALPAPKKLATSRVAEKASLPSQPPKPSESHGGGRSSTLQFPNGVVKKTWASGYPRLGDDIKIEEVLRKDDLELAIISSYQWDDEWMMSKLLPGKTKLLLVAFAADDAQKQDMTDNAPSNVKFSFPPMKGFGAMHSKLQVLKFSTHIRIVVPTGNMVPYDWGETGVMENIVFLIDLPRLSDAADHKPTPFSSELCRFLGACQVDEKLVRSLTNYDFSRTERLGFVHTIPGGHMDELRRHTGYCGLGDTISCLGLATNDPIHVDIVCASLGSINTSLVEAMYNACQGDRGMKEYAARTARQSSPSKALRDHMRIYFPTEQTVASSRGGRGAAGTICFQPKWWQSPTFPTDLVRDCVSKPSRTGILMHSKIIFVRGADGTKPWAYVGSANLSESAWGRLVKDSKSGKPKMSCRNWECGVVVPVSVTAAAAAYDDDARFFSSSGGAATPTTIKRVPTPTPLLTPTPADGGLDAIFSSTLPVPMVVPGRPYGPNEEPWFYTSAR